MGNRRSRELRRPKDNNRTCQCEQFDLSLHFSDGVLNVELHTDLPIRSLVSIGASHLLEDTDGHQWNLSLALLGDNRVSRLDDKRAEICMQGHIDDMDRCAMYDFRYLKGQFGGSLVAAGRPSRLVMVSASFP